MKERRRFKRYDQANFLKYKASILSVHADSMTKNICLKGTCFFSDKKLRPGKVVSLKIFYHSHLPSRKIKARVIHSMPVSDELGKGYFNGVEFLD